MSEDGKSIEVESILLSDLGDALFRTRPFSGTTIGALVGVEHAERVVTGLRLRAKPTPSGLKKMAAGRVSVLRRAARVLARFRCSPAAPFRFSALLPIPMQS